MERVCKPFTADGRAFTSGELKDFSEVKNHQRLLNQRYISPYFGEIHHCEICNSKFDSQEGLRAHLTVHPQGEPEEEIPGDGEEAVPTESVQRSGPPRGKGRR